MGFDAVMQLIEKDFVNGCKERVFCKIAIKHAKRRDNSAEDIIDEG
jgi:hypothetical protein